MSDFNPLRVVFGRAPGEATGEGLRPSTQPWAGSVASSTPPPCAHRAVVGVAHDGLFHRTGLGPPSQVSRPNRKPSTMSAPPATRQSMNGLSVVDSTLN